MTPKTLTRSLPLLLGALGAWLAPAIAHAQTKGFALDRFEPSERGSDWFTNESLDLRGSGRLALGIVGDYGHKPLVVYNSDGSEQAAVVRHQFFVHPGASLNLSDRFRVALSLPIALYQDGEAGTVNGVNYSSSNATTIGDLRLGGDVRLVGQYGDEFTLAAGAQLKLPTGSRTAFTSDGNVQIIPRVAAAGDVGALAYAVRAGVNIRPQGAKLQGATVGTELDFGAAVGVRLFDRALLLGPELSGATAFTDFFGKKTTPVELLIGGHYHFDGGFRLGLGVGPGLTRGFGVPDVRGLASIEWMEEIKKEEAVKPVGDRDGDGIIDSQDACPDVPGVRSEDPAFNGCPESDRDHDGILDKDDACPDTPGVRTDDPKTNGCPPAGEDRDHDGILDKDDACPDEPGPASSDPKKNGCPDRDKDGIIDREDACPDQPGDQDPDPKKNGCPKARIEAGQIKILEQVKFKFASADILPESDPILQAVLKIMNEHSEIGHLMVEGHTDNKGAHDYNMNLSRNRAASVKKWLTDHSVAAGRLDSAGYGPDRPIDSNATDAGRANNRRVEFHILGAKVAGVVEKAQKPAKAAGNTNAAAVMAPAGDKPKADKPKAGGDHHAGGKPKGDKPKGDKPKGDKKKGDKK